MNFLRKHELDIHNMKITNHEKRIFELLQRVCDFKEDESCAFLKNLSTKSICYTLHRMSIIKYLCSNTIQEDTIYRVSKVKKDYK